MAIYTALSDKLSFHYQSYKGNQLMLNIINKKICSVVCFYLAVLILPINAKIYDEKDSLQSIKNFENDFRNGRTVYATIEERMKLHRVPGVSIAVIKNGKLLFAKGYGVKQAGTKDKVNGETVFSVGSVSKVAAATATLRLVEQGKLNLDTDVNQYLTSWKVAENKYTKKQPVTLMHILSHTAGFTIHGFRDFQPGEKLPSALDTLMGRYPAKHNAVEVVFTPGTNFRYSGGGITVEQLVIEETTKLDFVRAAKKLVFDPLKMTRSTFQNPIPASHGNIARAHDANGEPRALPRGWEAMPEMAASGLWTTPTELATLIIALIDAYNGESSSILSETLVKDMMTRIEPGEFGLGPELLQADLFQHGGSNESYKAFMVANLKTGNGVVVLTNSASGRRIVDEIVETMKRTNRL